MSTEPPEPVSKQTLISPQQYLRARRNKHYADELNITISNEVRTAVNNMELYYLKKLDQVAIASDAPDLVSRCYAIDERLVKLIKRLNKTAGTTASRLATREMLNDMQEAINSLYDLL